MAAHTGIEPALCTSWFCADPAEVCGSQRVNRKSRNGLNCRVAQNYAVPVSEFVRKSRFGVRQTVHTVNTDSTASREGQRKRRKTVSAKKSSTMPQPSVHHAACLAHRVIRLQINMGSSLQRTALIVLA